MKNTPSFQDNKEYNNTNSLSSIQSQIKDDINATLNNSNFSHIKKLLDKEQYLHKGFQYNPDTLDAFYEKYPYISWDMFRDFFCGKNYNKNIFSCQPEIIDFLDLENISPGEDLIEKILPYFTLSLEDLRQKVGDNIPVISFPNLSSQDIAQGYFYTKLQEILPNTKIILGDSPEIKSYIGDEIKCDSVGFIDFLGEKSFNTCILKLLPTNPDPQKIHQLESVFDEIEKDVFLGGSTFNIPFQLPERYQTVCMPKTQNMQQSLELKNQKLLLGSMGYLNSAYYTQKVKGSFVEGSHNIAEPMHAGKISVINDQKENRYNHNWLISYFGEKSGLLYYTDEKSSPKEIQDFLDISSDELKEKNNNFQKLQEKYISPLVYGLIYNYLKKNFQI